MSKSVIILGCAIAALAASNALLFLKVRDLEQAPNALPPSAEHRIRMLEIEAEQSAAPAGIGSESDRLASRIDALEMTMRASQADTERALDDICVKSGYQACR